jgi:hypothetical protein
MEVAVIVAVGGLHTTPTVVEHFGALATTEVGGGHKDTSDDLSAGRFPSIDGNTVTEAPGNRFPMVPGTAVLPLTCMFPFVSTVPGNRGSGHIFGNRSQGRDLRFCPIVGSDGSRGFSGS